MTRYAVDICAGAGGLTRGLEDAGFSTVFAVENAPDACQTYRAAFPAAEMCQADIRTVDFTRWRGVDLVAGGPPCQPFSIGGHRLGKEDRRDLLPEFVRAVLEASPRAFLLENVPGLASGPHADYFAGVLAPLRSRYAIFGPYVINAADYGIPQSRKRLVVVGMAEGAFRLPTPFGKRVSAGEVLTAEPFGEPNPAKIVYAKNPEPRPNPYHGHLFNGGGRAVDPDVPAPTIIASAGGNKTHFLDCLGLVPKYHRHLLTGGTPWVGELMGGRRLTVRECALLQTFPRDVAFAGSRSSQYAQIGNAVPPQMGRLLGDGIMSGFKASQCKAVAA
jgi:DNA (cytosine-5)-methyltransferase 1